jgi:hypothetical protein
MSGEFTPFTPFTPFQPIGENPAPVAPPAEPVEPTAPPPLRGPRPNNGKRGGRPKGTKNKSTLAREALARGEPALREPVHEPTHEPLRVRRHNVQGKFHIPKEMLAKYLPGRSAEWKRFTVLGQEDPAYMLSLQQEGGWEPVQSYMMPGMMPSGYKGPILRDGMMLMERPQHLTDEARTESLAEAQEVIRVQEERLGIAGPGEMTRNHPDAKPRINTSYEPLAPRQKVA